MADKEGQVKQQVARLLERARSEMGCSVPGEVNVTFDLKGCSAGRAYRRNNKFGVRFNPRMMRDANWNTFLRDTVPHEVAHIVCFANPAMGRNHDPGWRSVCCKLGGSGERCHADEDVRFARGKTYNYTNTNGTEMRLSQVLHRRIQKEGYVYGSKKHGYLDKTCKFALVA